MHRQFRRLQFKGECKCCWRINSETIVYGFFVVSMRKQSLSPQVVCHFSTFTSPWWHFCCSIVPIFSQNKGNIYHSTCPCSSRGSTTSQSSQRHIFLKPQFPTLEVALHSHKHKHEQPRQTLPPLPARHHQQQPHIQPHPRPTQLPHAVAKPTPQRPCGHHPGPSSLPHDSLLR